jgi:hypothetical protein
MSSNERKLSADDRWKIIEKGWKVLEERNEQLVEEYLEAIREREKKEQGNDVQMLKGEGGQWEGRTFFDSDKRATGKAGYSSRDLRLKRSV